MPQHQRRPEVDDGIRCECINGCENGSVSVGEIRLQGHKFLLQQVVGVKVGQIRIHSTLPKRTAPQAKRCQRPSLNPDLVLAIALQAWVRSTIMFSFAVKF